MHPFHDDARKRTISTPIPIRISISGRMMLRPFPCAGVAEVVVVVAVVAVVSVENVSVGGGGIVSVTVVCVGAVSTGVGGGGAEVAVAMTEGPGVSTGAGVGRGGRRLVVVVVGFRVVEVLGFDLVVCCGFGLDSTRRVDGVGLVDGLRVTVGVGTGGAGIVVTRGGSGVLVRGGVGNPRRVRRCDASRARNSRVSRVG
jgi:hypothetical protein